MDRKSHHTTGPALILLLATASVAGHSATFDPALQPIDAIAPVALSDTGLTRDVTLFQPWFDAATWTGDLRAYAIDPRNAQTKNLDWSAAVALTAHDWRTRLIVTRRDDNGQAVAFRNLVDLSPTQQAALVDQARLDYLRGDASGEGTRFRVRRDGDSDGNPVRNILGAIIHANPVYISYGESAHVYTGANDGMLHDFDANTGNEVFAYIPSMIYQHLAALAEPGKTPHPPYTVDGGLAVAPILFHDGTLHTVLVGALGAGGQGLFALDITAPTPRDDSEALHTVLWEFSDSDDAALGYTYGTPQFVRLGDGRAAILVGNGYANTTTDDHVGSGTAALLIIDAERGTLIRRIDTYSGSLTESNGLSTPRAVDTDADSRVDYAYAGDLSGHLWRFDLRGSDSSAWKVSCNGTALFSTIDPADNSQAITTQPVIIAHPDQGLRVLFGTGRLLSDADLDPVSGAQINTVYGVWDRLDARLPDTARTRRQSITAQSDLEGQRVRTASQATQDGVYDIWRTDLNAGERVLTDPLLDNGHLVVTVTQPLSTPREVWLLELDALSGGAPNQIVFDLNGDGVLDAHDTRTADGEPITAQDRIAGHYYGAGAGSKPVFANLSATRHVAFINRNETTARLTPVCTADCGDTPIDDSNDTAINTVDDAKGLDSDALLDDVLTAIVPVSPCGVNGCVAEARGNAGRVAWKELLAE